MNLSNDNNFATEGVEQQLIQLEEVFDCLRTDGANWKLTKLNFLKNRS